ncbi:IclR family transcriptional regulator [Sodalis sp. RH16]|uniref:IclR family transcriptional regulator n=1 Tax=unclassified Sodalis (in: enterobacteria) TaxID=2636512 RepID=UPI0039B481D8
MSSLDTGLRILSLFNKERPVLRVGEVCRELDVPKSTVSRLMKTLCDAGFVERRHNENGYVVGHGVLALAELYLEGSSLIDELDAALERLSEQYHFVGYAAALSDIDIVLLRVKIGSHPLRLVHEVGAKMAAMPTALGLALFACEPDEEVLAKLGSTLTKGAEQKKFLNVLSSIREKGLVSLVNGLNPSISAMGLAIHDIWHNEKIAMSISYPVAAADADLIKSMQRSLWQEACAIGNRVGDPFWSRQTVFPDIGATSISMDSAYLI